MTKTIEVELEAWKKLKKLSADEDTPMKDLAANAIRKYVNNVRESRS